MENQQNAPVHTTGNVTNQGAAGNPDGGSRPLGNDNASIGSPALATPALIQQIEATAASMTPEQQRQVALTAAKHLSASDRQAIAQQLGYGLSQPNTKTRDTLWLIVVVAFVLVLLGSVTVLAVSVFIAPPSGGTSPQTILAVFTGVTGFLTGLFVPSPGTQGGASNNSSGPPQ